MKYTTTSFYFIALHTTIYAHDRKVKCNYVEYSTTLLRSDWLYFLWHGINMYVGKPMASKFAERYSAMVY